MDAEVSYSLKYGCLGYGSPTPRLMAVSPVLRWSAAILCLTCFCTSSACGERHYVLGLAVYLSLCHVNTIYKEHINKFSFRFGANVHLDELGSEV